MKPGGYAGKLLFVDLTTGRIKEKKLDYEMAAHFLGGRGLGARLLYDLCPKDTDPLGPDNPLIFVNGPLEGTKIPTASRYGVVTKSPLTDIYAYSVAGGFWGPSMKKTGYDAFIITGTSKRPVYLLINDRECRIKDASSLWGLGTFNTQKRLISELGDKRYKVACIGPAGENLVRFAGVISETRALGRCGVGAVMGSKKLKAIAITGDFVPKIAHPKRVEGVVKDIYKRLRDHPFSSTYLGELGTPGNTATVQRFKMLPTRNFQESVFDAVDQITGEHLNAEYVIKKRVKTCYRCPMACARYSKSLNAPYTGAVTEGPEYETIWSLGPNCGNGNLSAIIYFDHLCDDLGLDTMSTGSVIAFAMECFERGLLSKADTDGLDLKFGNSKTMGVCIENIAYRRGLGDLLAKGTRGAAKKIGKGAEAFAMHVKGLELGGYDPRGAKGLGIVYATGNRGGCHHASGYILPDEWESKEGRFNLERKAEIVRKNRNLRMLFDSAMLCTHGIAPLGIETFAKIIASVTGFHEDPDSLIESAERINCIERAFNVREGISRKDDILPNRILEESTSELPPFERASMDQLLDEYYKISGWDDNGIPKNEYVRFLGMFDSQTGG